MNHTFYYHGQRESERARFLDSARWILNFTKEDKDAGMLKGINLNSTCCFECRILDLIWQLKILELFYGK